MSNLTELWLSNVKTNCRSSLKRLKSEMNESELFGTSPIGYDDLLPRNRIVIRHSEQNYSGGLMLRPSLRNLGWMTGLAIIIASCAPRSAPLPPPPTQLPPVVQIRDRYPMIDEELLVCASEPVAPESLGRGAAEDRDAATYESASRLAGADCRGKLMRVRDLVATWPKE